MADNFLQETINAIARALSEEFPDAEIYDTPIRQGLKEPCFRIKCNLPSRSKIRGDLYVYDYLFDVAYFPEDRTEPEREIRETTERMQDALEIVSIRYSDGEEKPTWNSYPIEFSVVDDVLHAKVAYRGEYLRLPEVSDTILRADYNLEVN